MNLNLRSDNEAPAAPELLDALVEANAGSADAYGGDPWSARLDARFSELFETEVRIFPVTTGTAANVLCLSHATPPWGAVFCHPEAHVQVDECGAFELHSGGAKLMPVAGPHGRIDPEALRACITPMGLKGDHGPVPATLTLTQATECGTVYPEDRVRALCDMARAHGMTVHMDGARFANALASLDAAPADITWRAGVDMLSFATSKNGGLVGEAAVFFDPAKAEHFGHRRMKSGHLVSKMRYFSAPLLAYLENDLWLRLARQANDAAARIGRALAAHPDATLEHPVEANEVFVRLSEDLDRQLREAGVRYHPWPGQPGLFRMVASWCLEDADLTAFEALLAPG